MIIEVATIRPPKEGAKVATVVSNTGQAYQCWPDKAAALREGDSYDCEIETREWQGRPFRKIVKAKPVAAAPAAANGNARSVPISTPTNAEAAFVATVLAAFIAAGRIGLDARELDQATILVRSLWRVTFGGAP
jgi:hypothetical protein